jgi:pimeloyl-ACP methyl ester carboxylesterase
MQSSYFMSVQNLLSEITPGDRGEPQRLTAICSDGWPLAVWYRPAVQPRFAEPVILCHGFASNHRFFEFEEPQNLAVAFSAAGFDCYSVDLRGAGASKHVQGVPHRVTFDDHVRLDVPAIQQLIAHHHGKGHVIWVGHSLGGLLGIAASTTTMKNRLRALVTIGAPVRLPQRRHLRWLLALAQWVMPTGRFDARLVRYLAPLVGHVKVKYLAAASANLDNLTRHAQRQLLAHVIAPIWRGVLAQLRDWAVHDVFRSRDACIDYRCAANELTIPMLVVGGTVDGLCPETVTRQWFRTLTSPRKELAIFGRSSGHQHDYGHADLVVGRRADLDVYPVVIDFVARTATSARALAAPA